MRQHSSIIVGMFLFVLLLSFVPDVVADVAPPAFLHSLTQEAQDVKIRVAIEGEPWGDEVVDIVRTQGDVPTTVLSDVILSTGNADEVSGVCGDYIYYEAEMPYEIYTDEFCDQYPDVCLTCPDAEDSVCLGTDCDNCNQVEYLFYYDEAPFENDFCEEYPAYSKDCDRDGSAECCLVCDPAYYYDFWDYCVPPGLYRYYLLRGEGGADIEVVDAEVECDDQPVDTDETDTGTDSRGDDEDSGGDDEDSGGNDEDSGGANGGCQAVSQGETTTFNTFHIIALMLR
jgi:hypothetical protein